MVELPSWSIWKNAPEGATYCFKPLGVFFKPDSDNKMALHYSDDKWAESGYEYDELRLINLFEPRPAAAQTPDWSKCKPNIATHYGTILNMTGFWRINGDDVKFSSEGKGWVELKFQGDRTKLLEGLTPRPNRVIPDGIAQPPANKYDRTITGKYGTGQCTVDVYRVLNAFGPLSPEIDHAVKKLLAPGSRGHKDEKQDLLEAIQSIEARLQYLEAVNG